MDTINQYPVPLPTAVLATILAFLEEGLDHIMTSPQTGISISISKFMSLYTVVFSYFTAYQSSVITSQPLSRVLCLCHPSRSGGYLVLTYPSSYCLSDGFRGVQ
jgi:hypothetical protein